MVGLVQRIIKLEKQVTGQSQTDHLGGRSVYQPRREEFAEAVKILIECGAIRKS